MGVCAHRKGLISIVALAGPQNPNYGGPTRRGLTRANHSPCKFHLSTGNTLSNRLGFFFRRGFISARSLAVREEHGD